MLSSLRVARSAEIEHSQIMTEAVVAALVGGFVGSCTSFAGTYFLQSQLLRKQERFQREQADKQQQFQEKLLAMQHRHEEDMAREWRNYEKTGIASMRKIGGG